MLKKGEGEGAENLEQGSLLTCSCIFLFFPMLIYLQSLSKLGSRCKTCYSAVKKTRSSTTIDASMELQCMELDKRLVQEAPDQQLRSDISGSRYPLRYIQQETKTNGKNLQSFAILRMTVQASGF